MAKFKVGDKVKLVDNVAGSINSVGDVGVVTQVMASAFKYRVQVEGNGSFCNRSCESDLELVSEVNPLSEAKVGDRVRVVDPEFWVQGEGTLVKTTPLKVRFDEYVGYHSATDHHVMIDQYLPSLELIPQVTYEDQWRLNDGTEEIPEDADTLEKDGSVVAYRKVKESKVVTYESILYADPDGGLWRFRDIDTVGELKITTTVTDGVLTDAQVEILKD